MDRWRCESVFVQDPWARVADPEAVPLVGVLPGARPPPGPILVVLPPVLLVQGGRVHQPGRVRVHHGRRVRPKRQKEKVMEIPDGARQELIYAIESVMRNVSMADSAILQWVTSQLRSWGSVPAAESEGVSDERSVASVGGAEHLRPGRLRGQEGVLRPAEEGGATVEAGAESARVGATPSAHRDAELVWPNADPPAPVVPDGDGEERPKPLCQQLVWPLDDGDGESCVLERGHRGTHQTEHYCYDADRCGWSRWVDPARAAPAPVQLALQGEPL